MNPQLRRLVQAGLRRVGYQLVRHSWPAVVPGAAHDPNSAQTAHGFDLSCGNPRLQELRRRYADAQLPMLVHTWWNKDYIDAHLDLAHFRGDNAYVWQTRHMGETARQRYYLYARDVESRDALGLFGRLTEDGAFGCWVYRFHRFPAVSRDLLDSINELNFLSKHAGIADRHGLSILDIGAGYGRLAHRSIESLPNLAAYYCVDAIPESTFVCETYLRHRRLDGKARVLPIDELEALDGKAIQLAINIHSFSEMCLAAIEGWLDLVARLGIPQLYVIPNDPESFLTMEADHSRRDYLSAIESRGYRLVAKAPVIGDPDVRELVGVRDHQFLFERARAT